MSSFRKIITNCVIRDSRKLIRLFYSIEIFIDGNIFYKKTVHQKCIVDCIIGNYICRPVFTCAFSENDYREFSRLAHELLLAKESVSQF